jgi:hypothetical protein
MKLKGGVFTTSAFDNIDHNPSSTTSKGSFHGTGISLFQHPMSNNEGTERQYTTDYNQVTTRELLSLPESFTSVPPLILKQKDPPVPQTPVSLKVDEQVYKASLTDEYRWV